MPLRTSFVVPTVAVLGKETPSSCAAATGCGTRPGDTRPTPSIKDQRGIHFLKRRNIDCHPPRSEADFALFARCALSSKGSFDTDLSNYDADRRPLCTAALVSALTQVNSVMVIMQQRRSPALSVNT